MTLGGFGSIYMQPMCPTRPTDVCHHHCAPRATTIDPTRLHLHALCVPAAGLLGHGHAVGAVHAWGRVGLCWTLPVGRPVH